MISLMNRVSILVFALATAAALLLPGCGDAPATSIHFKLESQVNRDLKRHVLSPASFSLDTCTLYDHGKGYWVLQGQFDSQNVYGALLRSSYSAWYKVDSSGGLKLFALRIENEPVYMDEVVFQRYCVHRNPGLIHDHPPDEVIEAASQEMLEKIRNPPGPDPAVDE
ncbi:MAG: hypothetical protein AAGC44_05150 [Planctomycetota bacterium]